MCGWHTRSPPARPPARLPACQPPECLLTSLWPPLLEYFLKHQPAAGRQAWQAGMAGRQGRQGRLTFGMGSCMYIRRAGRQEGGAGKTQAVREAVQQAVWEAVRHLTSSSSTMSTNRSSEGRRYRRVHSCRQGNTVQCSTAVQQLQQQQQYNADRPVGCCHSGVWALISVQHAASRRRPRCHRQAAAGS
jgi:hypothetical protein